MYYILLYKYVIDCRLTDAARVTEPCDYGWSPFNFACYQIFLERMNWSAARASCQEKDADLLSLNPSDNVKMVSIVWTAILKTNCFTNLPNWMYCGVDNIN